MSDLISRQAAIKAFCERCGNLGEPCDGCNDIPLLYSLPSAEPKPYRMGYQAGYAAAQRWIPCSEKLPEARGLYLTTTKDKVVYCDYWNEDNFNRTEMVIAWMPLPAPYRSEGEKK